MISPESIARSPWKYQTEPFEIVPKLYYVGNTSVSAHLFDTGDGLLLLDTTYPQSAYLLLESIRKLGFDPKDIRWILHTHGHIDHFGATRMLKELYGCKTYMPAADSAMLDQNAELNYSLELGMYYSPPYDTWFEVDRLINPGDEMEFGNIKVTAYCAAGHTPGTMAYVFELPSGYRAAMHGGIGWNTLTAEYCKAHGLGERWRADYMATLKRLHGLKVDIPLGNHPGQTDTFRKKAEMTDSHNPFIDPTEWDTTLENLQKDFAQMLENDPL